MTQSTEPEPFVPNQPKHCQICFHDVPGHYPDCPILTGEPQRGGRDPLELVQEACARLQRHLNQGAEPYWMQDVRIAQKQIENQRLARADQSTDTLEVDNDLRELS